jgi:hypothetical protein
MKTKHVYLAQDLATATEAVACVRAQGVDEHDIALIARADLEMEQLPEKYRNASTDFVPAAIKGALGGGTAGLVAGLIAVAIPGLGVTLAGAAAIAAVGAVAGTWSSSLMGSALPDPVRRQFEDEIAAGRILVAIDAVEADHPRIEAALADRGVPRLPFEESSAMT